MIVLWLVNIVFGAITALIAVNRGRSGPGWFIVGVFTTCIGLVLVLVLPDLKVEEERRQRLTKENRRLKEALRKDRSVADQRHRETQQRLGAHDQLLDVDTSPRLEGTVTDPRLSTGSESDRPQVPRKRVDVDALGGSSQRTWYYLIGEQQVGPVSLASLGSLWNDEVIDGRTYVWRDSMDDWMPLEEVDELGDLTRG